MYVVTVDFQIHPAHRAEFLAAMIDNARASEQDEPGCRQFDVCVAANDPGHVFLYERYDDAAAFQAHLATAHFTDFNARTASWVVAKEVRIFTRCAGDEAPRHG